MRSIKCVIWDIDHTIFKDIISESDYPKPDPKILNLIKKLDKIGIVQSIASKNNYHEVKRVLEKESLWSYFISPKINWNNKSKSITEISQELDIDCSEIVFIDDDSLERAEVKFNLPNIIVTSEKSCFELFNKAIYESTNEVTLEAKYRKQMYLDEQNRKKLEENFLGNKQEFLEFLNLELVIQKTIPAEEKRVRELFSRVNRLRTLGDSCNLDLVFEVKNSIKYKCFSCYLQDRYGKYGLIGAFVIKVQKYKWTVLSFVMSCRTISRGTGTVCLNLIKYEANKLGKRLFILADFNESNKMMQILLYGSGFKTVKIKKNIRILEDKKPKSSYIPHHYTVRCNFD